MRGKLTGKEAVHLKEGQMANTERCAAHFAFDKAWTVELHALAIRIIKQQALHFRCNLAQLVGKSLGGGRKPRPCRGNQQLPIVRASERLYFAQLSRHRCLPQGGAQREKRLQEQGRQNPALLNGTKRRRIGPKISDAKAR